VVGGTRREAVTGFVRTSPGTLALGALTHPLFVRRIAASKLRAVVGTLRSNRRRAPQPGAAAPTGDAGRAPAGASFGILSIAVAPSHQGTGAASELLAAAEADARHSGFAAMNLTVDVDNHRAIRFYEKHGWRRDGTDAWAGRMVKVLRPT